ncbi:MAG: hypothetical protein RIS80_789 [Actinomycetota bacterium]
MQGRLPRFEASYELQILHSDEDEPKLGQKLDGYRKRTGTESTDSKQTWI